MDEPEIHLHPYAQRSLIKYLGRVVNNDELDFSSLLTDIFQINRLLGQILVVSHSPNILLDDYRQFLRFCKDESGCLMVRNGFDINLDIATEKQLLKNLPYVKEAFFSKIVILVEGDSELGTFPVFSERMNVDLDELGISVVQAGSADSIPPLMKLLNEFSIQNIGLMDADKKPTYSSIPNLFFTQGVDFEEDMYDSFNIADYAKYLEEEFPNEKKTNFFIGKVKSISVSLDPQNLIHPQLASLPLDKIQDIKNISKQDVLNALRRSKSLLTGRDLGKYVTEIPQVYKDLIQNAVELSKNVESIGTEPTTSED